MGLIHSPRIVTDGLILCLDAASKRSYTGAGTAWNDLIGGVDLTLINGAAFNSADAGSIVFDGTNDYAHNPSVPSDLHFDDADEFTCAFWVKCDDASKSRDSMVSIKGGAGNQNNMNGWSIGHDTTANYEWQVGNGVSFSLFGFGSINEEWQHVAVSHTSGNITCYVGSVSVYNGSAGNHSLFAGTNELYIGKRDGLGEYHNGNIACIQIYNKALTHNEIKQNYSATRGRFE
jgi:hypothetical protein